MVNKEECLTVSVVEAAAMLGLSKNNCYTLFSQGKLPGAIRIGKRIVVSRAVLESFINQAVEKAVTL